MEHRASSLLLGMELAELSGLVEELGEPSYRSRQLFYSIYRQRVSCIDGISTLPLEMRRTLAARGFEIGIPLVERRFQSIDGTVRYLLMLSDGQSVEAVWMPEGDEGETGDGSDAGDEPGARACN